MTDVGARSRADAAPTGDPLLVADGIKRRFGGVLAVDVEHLELARHTMTALIGPNGAGKTTLFNLLTGFDRPDEGTWQFDGQDLHKRSASAVARAGMVRTFQLTKALARLSVLDNVKLGAQGVAGEKFFGALFTSWRRHEPAIEERALELLDLVRLSDKRDDDAATLSGGQRKLLELARALMAEPKLLMLDEPMAGVNPALAEFLVERLFAVREQGVTIVYVEHELDVVMATADHVVCLAQGSIISQGPPDAVLRDPAVEAAYLGTARTERRREGGR